MQHQVGKESTLGFESHSATASPLPLAKSNPPQFPQPLSGDEDNPCQALYLPGISAGHPTWPPLFLHMASSSPFPAEQDLPSVAILLCVHCLRPAPFSRKCSSEWHPQDLGSRLGQGSHSKSTIIKRNKAQTE